MPSLAAACDQTGVSDRTAAMITSAVLHDIGEITEEDPSKAGVSNSFSMAGNIS